MDDNSMLAQQGGIAVMTVFALDAMKKSDWGIFKWINNNTETLNRLISLGVALGTSIGLKVISNTGDIHTGGVITIAYPSLAVIVTTLMHASGQFGGQEILHKLLGNHNMSKILLQEMQDMNKQLAAAAQGAK